jgi:ABC-type siderophore export system fused ATPase/permease subunit
MAKPSKMTASVDAQSDEKKSRIENVRMITREAKEDERKFEYFFASLASASFAYSAQQYKRPASLLDTLAWVEPVAIALILVAMAVSLWRLSELVKATSSNAQMIAAGDNRDTMMESLRDNPDGVKDLLSGQHTPPERTHARAIQAAEIRAKSKNQMLKHLVRAQKLSPIRFYGLGGGVLMLFVARLIGPT